MTTRLDRFTSFVVDGLLTDRQYASLTHPVDIRIEIEFPVSECRCGSGHQLRVVAISPSDCALPDSERQIGAALEPGAGFCSAEAHNLDSSWLAVVGADIRLTAHTGIADPRAVAICLSDAAAILRSPDSAALVVWTTVVARQPHRHRPPLPKPRMTNARYIPADLADRPGHRIKPRVKEFS